VPSLRDALHNIESLVGAIPKMVTPSESHRADLASTTLRIKNELQRIGSVLDIVATVKVLSSSKREYTDLHRLIQRCLSRYRFEAEAREVQIVLTSPLDHQRVPVDVAKMEVVFANVIRNAIQYSAPETEIRLGFRQDKAALVVEISNLGLGIRPEERDRVFEIGYRGTQATQASSSGAGLGLHIAREIVLAHQGDIQVKSKSVSGAGQVRGVRTERYCTTVMVRLPFEAGDRAQDR